MKKKSSKIIVIITIIFICIISLFLYLFFNGYSFVHLRNNDTNDKIKVACVGDSVTYGHGVSQWHKNNYPAVLQELLGEKYNVQNFGVSLSTVQSTGDFPYIETNLYKPSIEFDTDILVFMLGSNDSKPYNWTNPEIFKEHYIKLIDSYLSDENSPEIYLCTLAKVNYKDPNQVSGEAAFNVQADVVDQMNVVIKDVADERGYKLIDIYSVTASDRSLFQFDLVHPNVEGAKAIAEEVYKNIK